MRRANRQDHSQNWSFFRIVSVRLAFDLHPEAHTLIHLSGRDTAEVVRQALKEYAINHGHPAADPEAQAAASSGNLQPAAGQQPADAPKVQVRPAVKASPQLATSHTQPVQIPAPDEPQIKPRPKLDFGSVPSAIPEGVPASPGETVAKPANDPLAQQHHKWFKDEDQY